MFLQIAIFMFLVVAMTMIMVWYFMLKNVMTKMHNQTIFALESAISKHHFQMDRRTLNLNKYDFLKHNLDEALIMQIEIQFKAS